MSRLPPRSANLSDAIDAVLPQTQCTRCDYPACRPYAEAIANGSAEINQCPPGGAAGIQMLAQITGRTALPLNPAHGAEGPRRLALIDESRCIGCTLCIKACPVNAITGGFKLMHTVITQDCTGCELCIAPCPVDCIDMRDTVTPLPWTQAHADAARMRFEARNRRLQAIKDKEQQTTPDRDQLADILVRARKRAAQRIQGGST